MMCERCNDTGEVDSGAPDPQGHFVQVECECKGEVMMFKDHKNSEEMSLLIQAEIADIEGDKHEAEIARLQSQNAALLEALTNLVVRDLINDVEGDHYAEAIEAIRKATG